MKQIIIKNQSQFLSKLKKLFVKKFRVGKDKYTTTLFVYKQVLVLSVVIKSDRQSQEYWFTEDQCITWDDFYSRIGSIADRKRKDCG